MAWRRMSQPEPRVLQICHGYDGPFLDCARQYASLFVGTHYKVTTVYLTGAPSGEVERGSASDEVIFLDYRSRDLRGLKLKVIADIRRIARECGFAFCIAHRFKPTYIALLATRLQVIGVNHAFGVYQRLSRRLFANGFRKRLMLLGVSNAVRDDIRRCLPRWPAERIETLYNRLDIEAVQAEQLSRAEARETLGLPQDAWIVGNVGRLHPDKDQATLLRGFAEARPHLPAESLLVIMGSGALAGALSILADELGISDQVCFLGQVSSGRRYFRAFDLFALSSDHEPFGMVLLEAMAAEVPTLCSNCGGGREVVRDHARLFELGQAGDLAELLVRLSVQGRNIQVVQSQHKMLRSKFSDHAARQRFWSLSVVRQRGEMEMTSSAITSPLVSKARALDRYRWQLLRERHGIPGSAVRFVRDAVKDWWFGSCAKRHLAGVITPEPCDFLLLQSAPKVIVLQRKRRLIDELLCRGYRLIETASPEIADILKQRQLLKPSDFVPTRYYGYAAHAEWLVERYQPQVLLNDRNGSLYSPFLRDALNRRNRLLVHLAHATTVEASQRLAMNDYDYYLVFGQSSLEALKARPLRFGSSNVVLTGSHMIDSAYDLPASSPRQGSVLILGVGPDKEKVCGYQQTYGLLADWARCHPEHSVLVKAHPRSRVPYWHEVAKSLTNVRVLPIDCNLAEALSQAWVVVNIMSNAVIEAALARRPVIHVNLSSDRDIFSQDHFLGRTITTFAGLESRASNIEANYDHYVERSQALARFHLTYACDGLMMTIAALEGLLNERQLPASLKQSLLPTTIS
jgi:glycosyltransferase involved in cell wall biosynthesis